MREARRLHYGHAVRRFSGVLFSDWVIAAGLVVLGEIEVWVRTTYTGPRGLTSALALVRGLALAWRRRRPIAALAIVIAASAPVLLYDAAPVRHDSVSAQLAVLFALFAAGAYASGRAGRRRARRPRRGAAAHLRGRRAPSRRAPELACLLRRHLRWDVARRR